MLSKGTKAKLRRAITGLLVLQSPLAAAVSPCSLRAPSGLHYLYGPLRKPVLGNGVKELIDTTVLLVKVAWYSK